MDKLLAPYATKSFQRYFDEYYQFLTFDKAHELAMSKVKRDFEQGWQGIEMKLNTVGSSRGDYPFITMTLGLATDEFGKMASKTFLNVHAEGQGKEGHKKPVLFPKIVFLYDEKLHGKGCPSEDVFEDGIYCSSKTMYPDWLSLTGEGYVSEMYKKYGAVVSPMGSVDGNEVITYKDGDTVYTESFKRFWDKYSKKFEVKRQIGDKYDDRDVYISPSNVKIWDSSSNDWVEVKHITKNYCEDWVDIRLSGGRMLTCTSDHPLQTTRGRVLVKDLKEDDVILCTSESKYTEYSTEYDEDKAWLYAFIMCDGNYNQGVSVSIALEGEDDIQEKFISCYKKYTGKEVHVHERRRGVRGNYKDINGVGGDINQLQKTFVDAFGGLNKSERHVPNAIFNSPKNVRYAFLAGIIDADGYINNNTKGKTHCIVQIGSVTKELAIQYMFLANSIGYNSKLFTNKYNKNSDKRRYAVEFVCDEEILKYIVCEKKRGKYIPDNRKRNDIVRGKVNSITYITKKDKFGYDVTTSSDKFDVSGICSHNCRAFLSPWFERGGMYPDDENDKPVFVGRFNIGAISLNLPLIYAKAKKEQQDFFETLNYYLEMIREIHKRTYDYLGELKASVNPVGFCEGGFYGGTLKPNEKIKPLLKPMTASFGVTALNELQRLHNGKSLVEDNEFSLSVMKHINERVTEYKKEDGWLYAVYATPAENLCSLQVEQFRKMFGIVEDVSDRQYVSNSFHCHVTEDITPIQKQDLESQFWDYFDGGKIQYVRYPIDYNIEAVRTLVRRAMKMGFYEGVNLSLAYCNDCGHEELEMDVCPKCGSKHLTKIDRMNGYLSYSLVNGDTRLNSGKMAELSDRVSM